MTNRYNPVLPGNLTDAQKIYFNTNPAAAFDLLFPFAQGLTNPFGAFLRGQADNYLKSYQAKAGMDPSLNYLDFLGGQNPWNSFMMQAPQQRGENPSLYAPRVQFKY